MPTMTLTRDSSKDITLGTTVSGNGIRTKLFPLGHTIRELVTDVTITCSNPNLTVVSTYTGTKPAVGIETQNFTYLSDTTTNVNYYCYYCSGGTGVTLETDGYIYFKKNSSHGQTLYSNKFTSGSWDALQLVSSESDLGNAISLGGGIIFFYYYFVDAVDSSGLLSSMYASIMDDGSSSSGNPFSSITRYPSGDLGTSTTTYNWKKDGTIIQPSDYYLSISGTPSINDTITVTYNTHY